MPSAAPPSAFTERRDDAPPRVERAQAEEHGPWTPRGRWTALAFSSLRLMAELGKNPQRASADAPSFEIAFTTADVAAAVQRAVDAGARLVQAPQQMPWGQTVAYVADINGALVELCTPVAPPVA